MSVKIPVGGGLAPADCDDSVTLSGDCVDYEVLILCDDEDVFLRHICSDADGNRTQTNTLLDGVTPYNVVGFETSCDGFESWTQCLTDDVNGDGSLLVDFIRIFFVIPNNGGVTQIDRNIVDATFYVPQGTVTICRDEEHYITAGYVETCDLFSVRTAVEQPAVFDDSPVGTNTIVFDGSGVAQLVRTQIGRALQVEEDQVARGLAVTPFFIATDIGTFEFNPSALQAGAGVTLTFDDSGVLAWPNNGDGHIETITGNVYDNCECRAVEIVQRFNPDTGETFIVDVVDPQIYNRTTGLKQSLLDENLNLPLGTLGAFTGGCPPELQVLGLDPLCCNGDLANNSPAVAGQRLAWLDASDRSLMIGSTLAPVENTGDEVIEVQDKLAPGISPSFVVPVATPTGDIAPINPPTFVESGLNGLSTIAFDSDNRERMRLDTDNPPGSDFTLFYLLKAEDDPLVQNTCVLAVSPTGGDGVDAAPLDGSWQFSKDFLEPSFIFRLRMEGTEYALGVDPPDIVRSPILSDEASPSNPQARFLERSIASTDDFFNDQFHLITAQLSGDDFRIFFDGDLRYQTSFATFPLTRAAIGSDYFRLFGNRFGEAFLSGELAEIFFADSAMTDEDIATVNAYLICKWGIDPSLAAGGAGDLQLETDGTFDTPSPFVRIQRADGSTVYKNTEIGLEYPTPPLAGLAVCETDDQNIAVNIDPATAAQSTSTVDSVSNAGAIANGLYSFSISNVGVAAGTVDGSPFPVGASVAFEAYLDPVTNEFKRPLGISYDATGTTFLIARSS